MYYESSINKCVYVKHSKWANICHYAKQNCRYLFLEVTFSLPIFYFG